MLRFLILLFLCAQYLIAEPITSTGNVVSKNITEIAIPTINSVSINSITSINIIPSSTHATIIEITSKNSVAETMPSINFIEIVGGSVAILDQPLPTASMLFKTTTGNIFEVVTQNRAFYQVNLPKKNKGWIAKTDSTAYFGPKLPQILLDNMILIPIELAKEKKQKLEDLYTYGGQENYRYPRKERNQNIDLSVDGFYEIKLSGRDFGDGEGGRIGVTESRYEAVVRDPIYNKIPKDVIRGDPKLDIRYHIKIDGQLDDDLSVHYDIEQEPDFPGKYDVRVQHKRKELTFYHLDANFQNGEFINVNKALNGAKYTQQTDNSEIIVATGKQRSEPKKFETQGNGQTRINLGNTSIFRDSLMVWVNNQRQSEGKDFTANYFEGYLEFKDPPQREDYIEVVYEFTNPIEDFLPVLSRKNFTGAQYKWASQEKVVVTKQDAIFEDKLWPQSDVSTANIATVESILKQFIADELPTAARKISAPSEDIPKPIKAPKYYPLSHRNIVLGSDTLSLNGRELMRNQDYFIDHSKGSVTLRETISADDQLSIVYRYYLSSSYQEDLIGNNTPGPYQLERQNLLDRSVSVKLDGKTLEDTLDYLVDLDKGVLYFNYKINYPKIITIAYDAINTTVVTESANQTPFNFGVTYMREYAKSQQDELELSISSENFSVTNNIISGLKNPLINTSDIKVMVDSELLSADDYTISDPYKGEITLKEGGTSAIVSYTYKKSFRTKVIHQITLDYDQGSEEFNNEDQNGLFIRDLPVKYQGVEFIRYRAQGSAEEIYLENGIEFIADYRDNGQVLGIRFLTKSDTNKASRLDNYPKAGDVFIIEYQYSPDESLDPGDINQTQVGITVGGQLSPRFRVDTEIVGASHNFSKPRASGSTNSTGTGIANQDYALSNTNLVEDSEQVFLNDILQTKDNDYIINYSRGTVKFRNQTPASEDRIYVLYDYYENQGTTQAGQQQKMKYATKLSTEYKTDSVIFTNAFKYIDKDYLSISPIKESKGTLYYGSKLAWQIDGINSFDISYDRRKLDRGAKDDNSRRYLIQDDVFTNATIRLFDYFDTKNSARYSLQLEEAIETDADTGVYSTDSLTWGYNNSVRFGPKFLSLNAARTFSRGITDYLDAVSPNITEIETYSYKANYSVNEVDYIGNFSFNPFYNNSWTKSKNADETLNSYQYRQSYGFGSTLIPKQYLSSTWSHSFSEIKTQTSQTASLNITQSFNSNYGIDYTPISWFSSSWRQSHTENESPLLGQKGLIDDRMQFNIKRFSLFGALTQYGARHDHYLVKPLDSSYFTFGMTHNNKLENNRQKEFDNKTNSITFNSFKPLSFLSFPTLALSKQESLNLNNIASSAVSHNRTTQLSEKKRGSMTIKTNKTPVLRLFNYTYTFDESTYDKKSRSISNVSTSNISTEERPNFTRAQRLNFDPGALYIRLTNYKSIGLGRFSAYVQENWTDNVNRTESYDIYHDGSESTRNVTADSFFNKKYTFGANYSPFNIFSTESQYVTENTIYRRNVGSVTGVTYKEGKQHSFKANYSPFRFIRFDGSLKRVRTTQYKSNAIDTDIDSLKDALALEDFDILANYLNSISFEKSVRSTLTPSGFFSFFSLVGGYSETLINEEVRDKSTDIDNEFLQQTGTAGSIFRPLRGMKLAYDYSVSRTRSNSGEKQIGYGDLLTASYQPIKTKHIQVNVQYSRDHKWGYNFNRIAQSNSEQGSGDTIQTEVVNTDDIVETGSLKISIDLPLTNSPFVQNLLIEGEGYLKKIVDKQDKDRAIGNKQSYDISGMVIKGTLFF